MADRQEIAERLAGEFGAKRALYDQLTNRLQGLLEDILDQEGIGIHVIERRTKTVESLRQKISRPNKAYEALDQIEDLSGLRVIVHYTTDVERVSTVLHREFNISPNASEETVKRLAADQFGYVSVHHVLTLGESRSDLGEWKTVAGLKAEVQVRTIGQHAWAAISHALQYKRNNDAPLATQRRLARLAGLLELVDEESERLRAEHETHAEKISELLKRGVLRIPIDTESLQQYLRWTPHSKTLAEAATLAGFLDSDEELIDVTRSTIISELVALAGAVQLDNLEDLDSILRDNANAHHPFFTALIESSRDEGSGGWSATAPFFVMLSVLFSKHKLVTPELMAAIGWHESVASRVLRVARSVTAQSRGKK